MTRAEILKMPKGDLRDERDKHLKEMREAHYRLVQFYTGLSAGMLGLTATQASLTNTINGRTAAILALVALGCLAMAVVLGSFALSGEKALRHGHVKDIQDAFKRHHEDEAAASRDIRQGEVLLPSRRYHWAFVGQCVLAVLAVLILVLSQGFFLVPETKPATGVATGQTNSPPASNESPKEGR